MDRDTIVALSTPPGESGIAVVRVSGRDAVEIADGIAPGIRKESPNRVVLKMLRDAQGEPLDEALVVIMRAPASYTGEDLVEISCHGSMQVVADLLEEIMSRGARLAAAGEFTKRAFLNGKLDLAQAESIADLIAAETKLQRRVAVEQLGGRLSRSVRECEEMLLEELAFVEAAIDFSEDEVPLRPPAETLAAARRIRERIAALLESEVAARKLRRGVRITILGPRNVGKSSLYNALLGEERAIVSPMPGTTRDLIRERIHIGGFTCYLEDTAGIAETGCDIEARGIMMGREAADRADLVLFVLDGSAEIDAIDTREIARIDEAKRIVVLNKSDIFPEAARGAAMAKLGANDLVAVSAITGDGLDELRARIFAKACERAAGAIGSERIAVNARQADALREAAGALERLEELVRDGGQAEIMSMELRAAADALGRVTGRSIADETLDAIFSRFCIGK